MSRERAALLLTALSACLALAGCGQSYPKDKLDESIKKLFKKEVGTDEVQSRLVGKTLYVSFPLENMINTRLDLPKDVTDKLESALMSIIRIALSTDAKIDFTVLKARDYTWGVETTFLRRVEDIKLVSVWRISKEDFDERFILESRRFDPASKTSEDFGGDVTLPQFMAHWVAFRINFGSVTNPFLGTALGIEKVSSHYDEAAKVLTLTLEESDSAKGARDSAKMNPEFIKRLVLTQMKKIEKKYLSALSAEGGWAEKVMVKNSKGDFIFEAGGSAWRRFSDETQHTDH